MSLTIGTAATELKKKPAGTVGEVAPPTPPPCCGNLGNSGVILSLLFRGFAKAVKEKREYHRRSGSGHCAGLRRGCRL